MGINKHINIQKAATYALLKSFSSQINDIWQSDFINRTPGKLNARQFFQQIMNARYSMTKEQYTKYENLGTAPEEPNAHADGSYKIPNA